MKKFLKFCGNSIVLFWSYFIISWLLLIVLQTLMRFFVEAQTQGEYLWKTIFFCIVMVAVCTFHVLFSSPTYKMNYLKHIEGKRWSLVDSIKYTLNSSAYWQNTLGFIIWPFIFPNLSFGIINKLYFNEEILAKVSPRILSIVTMMIPFAILSVVAWIMITYRWAKNKIHPL